MSEQNILSVVGKESKEIEAKTESPKRRRSPTVMNLQWLAERVRKSERIKNQLAAGTYHIDSHEVAKAVLGCPTEDLKVIKHQ